MLYDGFTFFNELDILEVRLNTLDSVVDKFILVEATKSFRGNDKALVFDQNKERFAKFLDKIIHVVVDDMPDGDNAWVRENFQRNCIARGLPKGASPDDRLMVSDADEIPRPTSVQKALQLDGIVMFLQDFYYYGFNCLGDEIWQGTRMVPLAKLKTPQEVRFAANYALKNAGWHFSYLGGVEAIITKIDQFAHQEFNSSYYKNPERIREVIASGKDLFNRSNKWKFVEMGDSHPEYVMQNLEKFKQHIF